MCKEADPTNSTATTYLLAAQNNIARAVSHGGMETADEKTLRGILHVLPYIIGRLGDNPYTPEEVHAHCERVEGLRR